MKKIALFFLLIFSSFFLTAQTVFGKWHTVNKETNKIISTIEVYQNNNKLYAKIININNKADKEAICKACKGIEKNQPILGLIIVNGLKNAGNTWTDGKILDPNNGEKYSCTITLKDKNTLQIRGYIGFSIFGRTDYWYRIK